MKKIKRNRALRYVAIIAAATAICWDIAISKLEIQEGTFKYESEFDALSGATTVVSIVTSDYDSLSNPVDRATDPSYMQIEEMVEKAIELQGGLDWVINKGDKVMIKVNLVGGDNPPGDGENTDPRVVKALVRQIHDHTGGDVEIQIAEGTARTNDDPTDPNSVWGYSGYINLLSDTLLSGINFSLLNLNQTTDDLVEVDLGTKGTHAPQGTTYYIHKAELEADVFIAVPVLKIHNTGITNALKLQIGTAPGCYYGWNKMKGTTFSGGKYLIHDIDQRVWTTEAIVDLCYIADIDFVLVDAIMCLERQKNNTGSNQVRFNTVLAGADPVAIDHVSAKLMGLNPDDVAHVTLAEKVGLGTNDPEHIDVAGVPINKAMKRVVKSQSTDGKYGQSNRTWILSPPFEGSDFEDGHFVNEPDIQPIPGQDGWSEAVYFFDDRIDLHAFYEGKTNLVSYAFTYFHAVKDQEAQLWLGSDEAIAVSLNGEEVYNRKNVTTYRDSDRAKYVSLINVKEGRNTLLVKTFHKYGDYSFALNICETEISSDYAGNRVAGLKFYVDESGSGTTINTSTFEAEIALPLQVYPNPASDCAKISFELAESRQVTVNILDMNGRLIRSLGREFYIPGIHEITWDLDNSTGVRVPEGVYICTAVSGDQVQSFRLIVK